VLTPKIGIDIVGHLRSINRSGSKKTAIIFAAEKEASFSIRLSKSPSVKTPHFEGTIFIVSVRKDVLAIEPCTKHELGQFTPSSPLPNSVFHETQTGAYE